MRLATTLTLALCSDGVNASHKHRAPMHRVVYKSFNPAATALAPWFTIVSAAPAATSDEGFDGLSRDPD